MKNSTSKLERWGVRFLCVGVALLLGYIVVEVSKDQDQKPSTKQLSSSIFNSNPAWAIVRSADGKYWSYTWGDGSLSWNEYGSRSEAEAAMSAAKETSHEIDVQNHRGWRVAP